MARGRLIAKSLSTSHRYAALHTIAPPLAEFCQAMYPLLVAHADDFGRLAGDVFTVRYMVVPTSPRPESDVEAALEALADARLIRWYVANERQWIAIEQFDTFQSGLHKRTQSAIPPPPETPGTSGNLPDTPGISRSRARAELKGTEGKGRELKGREGIVKGREGKRPRAGAPRSSDGTTASRSHTDAVNGSSLDGGADAAEALRRLKTSLGIAAAPVYATGESRRRSRDTR